MRLNCCPVCLCADNMPFSYVTPPLSIPLTGRRIQQRYMSSFFLHLFTEVYSFLRYIYSWSQILANYSNPTNVLKIFSSRYRCLQIALFFFIDFSLVYPLSQPSCFRCCSSINLQVCTPKKLYVLFVWLCVQTTWPSGVYLHRCDFQSPLSSFFLYVCSSSSPPGSLLFEF